MALHKPRPKPVTKSTRISTSLIPTEKTLPPNDLSAYSILVYGEAGIGKSSLASRFPGAMTLQLEPAADGIAAWKTPLLDNWDLVRNAIQELCSGDFRFKNIVWDTAPVGYDECLKWVGRKNGFEHPGDVGDFGASWQKVLDEFIQQQNALRKHGYSIITLAHEKLDDMDIKAGRKYFKVKPNFGGKAEQYYRSTMSIIAYYYAIGQDRWLQIVGDDFVTAKCNPENNFFTPNGDRIYRIPMGDNADDAYKNLINAFNNKQKETYREIGVEFIAEERRAGSGKFGKVKKREPKKR